MTEPKGGPIVWNYDSASPEWSAQIDYADPRIEAMARRFCAMGGINPDTIGGHRWGGSQRPRWEDYALAMAQLLEAADTVDPLRKARK